MTDPRVALRDALAHWVQLRAAVRAHAARLGATHYSLERDAARDDGAEYRQLCAQVAEQRSEMETLGRELDGRIAYVMNECAALDAAYRANLVDHAALTRRRA